RLDELPQLAQDFLVQHLVHPPRRLVRRDRVVPDPPAVGVLKEILPGRHGRIERGPVDSAALGRWIRATGAVRAEDGNQNDDCEREIPESWRHRLSRVKVRPSYRGGGQMQFFRSSRPYRGPKAAPRTADER